MSDRLQGDAAVASWPSAAVAAVHKSATHSFSKTTVETIELLPGLGVAGDAHLGRTVQHRARMKKHPAEPNLRQVHLIHMELLEELRDAGFHVRPGGLGENITTRGIALLNLPAGTRLHIGADAVLEVTGLRNPCSLIDDFQPGLMKAVLCTDADGNVIRKSGIMSVVLQGGQVRAGDTIRVAMPEAPWRPLPVV
ncbi:MAG: MOSC domain-containing protein [Alicyclobacillus sp.]|nr:MOSC domain-containing protein [Alicyclobacillus sp.]